MVRLMKAAPPPVVVLNPSEKEYLRAQVAEIVEQYGDRITGSYIMVRLEDSSTGPLVHRRRSWRNTSELAGFLTTFAVRMIDREFSEHEEPKHE